MEEFIKKNKALFDSDIPNERVWAQISNALDNVDHQTKSKPLMSTIRIAAMFVVVLGVGTLIGLQLNRNVNFETINEMKKLEAHYQKEIDNNLQLINNTTTLNYEVLEDIRQLDALYDELKAEIMQNPTVNPSLHMETLKSNYENKLELIQKLIQKHNITNQTKNIEDDKVEI